MACLGLNTPTILVLPLKESRFLREAFAGSMGCCSLGFSLLSNSCEGCDVGEAIGLPGTPSNEEFLSIKAGVLWVEQHMWQ